MKAVYPGSFDPITYGHLDIITRASRIVDELVVGILVNNTKRPMFTMDERLEMLRETVKDLHNVEVKTFEGMTIEDYGDDNFHNEARTKRYIYFGEIVKKYKAKYLFTAHHGDDLTETILMRIVRGSTLRGYSGFSKVIKRDGYTLIRPLIEVTKDEIVSFNKKNKIHY